MVRLPQVIWHAALVSLVAPCALSVQSGRLASHLHHHAITMEDVNVLSAYVQPTLEQRAALLMLTEGAMEEMKIPLHRLKRSIRARDMKERSEQQAQAARDAAVADFARIEQAWLDDCKAVLTPDQDDGWSRFLKARTRVLLSGWDKPLCFDPSAALVWLGIDLRENPEADAIVRTWEDRVHGACQEWLRLGGLLDGDVRGDERLQLINDRRNQELVMRQASIRAARSLAPLVPENRRTAFLYMRAAALTSELPPNMRSAPIVQEVLAIPDLPEERRRAVLTEAEKTQSTITQWLALRATQAEDQLLAATTLPAFPMLKDPDKVVATAQHQLEKRVLSLLSKDELVALEAIEPVMNASSWMDFGQRRMLNIEVLPGMSP